MNIVDKLADDYFYSDENGEYISHVLLEKNAFKAGFEAGINWFLKNYQLIPARLEDIFANDYIDYVKIDEMNIYNQLNENV